MSWFFLFFLFFQAATNTVPSWPKWTNAKKDEFAAKLALYKRATPERVDLLAKDILGYGKGAVPILLESLANADVALHERYFRVLNVLTDAGDLSLLLQQAKSKSLNVRRFILRRGSELADKEHESEFEKALEDQDADCRFYAALGVSRAGSFSGLPLLLSEVNSRWGSQRAQMLAALRGIQGTEATKKLLSSWTSEEGENTLSFLRLLSGVGDRNCVTRVSYYLDSSDHQLKEAAINVLRSVFDNAPPIQDLSVFDVIEHANQWKSRLANQVREKDKPQK